MVNIRSTLAVALAFVTLGACAPRFAPIANVTIDRASFSHMGRGEAVAFLQQGAAAYDPSPAVYDPTEDEWVYAPTCKFSAAGIFDFAKDTFVPYAEWTFRERYISRLHTSQASNEPTYAATLVTSRAIVDSPSGPQYEMACLAYRRKLPAPEEEVRRQLSDIATALSYLGAEHQ